jgi:hypothetical protein
MASAGRGAVSSTCLPNAAAAVPLTRGRASSEALAVGRLEETGAALQDCDKAGDGNSTRPLRRSPLGLGRQRCSPPPSGHRDRAILQSANDARRGRCEIDPNRVCRSHRCCQGRSRRCPPAQSCVSIGLAPFFRSNSLIASAYSDPARRTSNWVASSNRWYACAASTIASDCAG